MLSILGPPIASNPPTPSATAMCSATVVGIPFCALSSEHPEKCATAWSESKDVTVITVWLILALLFYFTIIKKTDRPGSDNKAR